MFEMKNTLISHAKMIILWFCGRNNANNDKSNCYIEKLFSTKMKFFLREICKRNLESWTCFNLFNKPTFYSRCFQSFVSISVSTYFILARHENVFFVEFQNQFISIYQLKWYRRGKLFKIIMSNFNYILKQYSFKFSFHTVFFSLLC